MKCSNCDAEVVEKLDTLMVTRGLTGRSQIAVICKTCETGVLTMKIVLARREEKTEFAFEGYLPVSSVK
jgi:hypothetical protein